MFVSQSNSHGLELFAAEDIEGGQFVLEWRWKKFGTCSRTFERSVTRRKALGLVSGHTRPRLPPRRNTPRLDGTIHQTQLQSECDGAHRHSEQPEEDCILQQEKNTEESRNIIRLLFRSGRRGQKRGMLLQLI